MSSQTILSNARHFRRYMAIRYSVIFIFFTSLGLSFTSFGAGSYFSLLLAIGPTAFGMLVLFEWLQRPAFLEIQRTVSGLRGLSIYYPEKRFFHFFRPGGVLPLVLKREDRLIVREKAGFIPLFNKVRFTIQRDGDAEQTTRPLDFGWATPAQRLALRSVVDEYLDNKPIIGGRAGIPFSLGRQ